MPSASLNVISHCAKSPWFSRTANDNALYGEYAGRLVLLSIGNDTTMEYWKLRREVGLFDVPERPVEIRGRGAVEFMNRVFTRPVDGLRVGRGSYGLLCHQGGGMVCDGIIFRLGRQPGGQDQPDGRIKNPDNRFCASNHKECWLPGERESQCQPADRGCCGGQ